MSKHDELVKALRYCVNARNCEKCAYRINNNSVKCRIKHVEDAADAIEELKAQLPKQGEWIWIQKENGGQYKGCSVCHAPIPTDSMLDYLDDEDCDFCYSCGAKMEVQE